MANTVKLKTSNTASSVPTTGNLADGEVATNTADKKIYQRVGASIILIADATTTKFFQNLLVGNVSPDTSGNVFVEPYSIKATNDFFLHNVWVFNNPTADEKLYGSFELPAASASGATFKLVWTTTAITGTAQWSVKYRVVTGSDTTSLDQSSISTTVTAAPTAPGTTDRRMETSFTATNSDFATVGTVQWILTRVDASDTVAAAITVHGFRFECVV